MDWKYPDRAAPRSMTGLHRTSFPRIILFLGRCTLIHSPVDCSDGEVTRYERQWRNAVLESDFVKMSAGILSVVVRYILSALRRQSSRAK